MKVRVDADLDARTWLVAHGYQDVVALINGLMAKWKAEGKRTRKDWWVILAGTANGKPRRLSDVTFPVLKAARRRQGFPPDVPEAIENSPHELAPSIRQQSARWGKFFKRGMR